MDINYWTIFQKMPLLHYMHGIELTPFSNLRGWIDRMSKYASDILSLAKDLTKENKEGQLRQVRVRDAGASSVVPVIARKRQLTTSYSPTRAHPDSEQVRRYRLPLHNNSPKLVVLFVAVLKSC